MEKANDSSIKKVERVVPSKLKSILTGLYDAATNYPEKLEYLSLACSPPILVVDKNLIEWASGFSSPRWKYYWNIYSFFLQVNCGSGKINWPMTARDQWPCRFISRYSLCYGLSSSCLFSRRFTGHTGPHRNHHRSTCFPTARRCTPGTSRWPSRHRGFTRQLTWKSRGPSSWVLLIMFTSHLYEARRPISTTRRATDLVLGEVNSCHLQLSFAQLQGNLNFKSHSSTGLVTILMSKHQVMMSDLPMQSC